MMKFAHEICGAIHLHTNYSDGGISYEELIDAASSLCLDYVVVTDHMSLGGKKDGYEGFRKNVCVLVGYEHHDKDKLNHYLAMGVNNIKCKERPASEYIRAIRDAGGMGFIAHPEECRHYFGNLPPYPWTDWSVDTFDGIEIWNQMSDWVEQLKSWLSFVRIVYPRRFLGAAPQKALQKWDALNRIRMVSGIGGVDAHSFRIGFSFLALTIFPIKVMLKGIRTHLYLASNLDKSDYQTSQQMIKDALRNGSGFFSNYRRGDARGSLFYIDNKDGIIHGPGKSAQSTFPAVLNVVLPESAEIHLINNGIKEKTIMGSKAQFKIESNGVYRIEVTKKSKAWIYSNPFPVGPYPI
ncbi:MAG TPA: PHP domain-containing protein [Chitinispirillaceae bacterium]|nr:PHP domain-containing protein [Chitinispirillaceae bacterium]